MADITSSRTLEPMKTQKSTTVHTPNVLAQAALTRDSHSFGLLLHCTV